MKERPILFSGPMVLATLDDSKRQTRRIVKPEPSPYWYPQVGHYNPTVIKNGGYEAPGPSIFGAFDENEGRKCPYGQPGDRLWVRETWAEVGTMDPGLVVYRADYPECVPPHYENIPPAADITWKPSIHMFRRFSRITLEITGARVERLQDISEADAKAEGADCLIACNCTAAERALLDLPLMENGNPYRNGFALLWESINGDGSWGANPLVWVVEFKRINS